ncbi:HEAT repeat domain-containing protein [Paenibacillus sp. MBLB4367]|uniref:HEAT repeat domain-containing protein n=1 Tax=Paenibacillus sp. MBLB4367 TaxID=3384767 RepID=UPI003907FA1A
MSIPVLRELHNEVRRLFIAGSGMAAGDARLLKLLPQLEKLGESAPVLARLAEDVKQLTQAGAEQASAKLLELGTLLHAVLYTQGQTDAKGSPEPVRAAETSCLTQVPYRKLKPLLEALTQKGQGRYEVVRQGFEEKLFEDIRTFVPAIAALDDSFAELAEYMAQTVVPSFGASALPLLKEQFKLHGGKGDARRLQLIHRFAGSGERELVVQAAAEGSLEVRTAAIELLGDYPELEPLILQHADDKKKEVRRAALSALARLKSDAAVERLLRALADKDQEIAIEPIQQCSSERLNERLLQVAEELLERLEDSKPGDEAIPRLYAAVQCLEGRRDATVSAFLQRLLGDKTFMARDTGAVQDYAAQLLLDMKRPEAYDFLLSLQKAWNRRFAAYSFRAAVLTLQPGEVYDRFAGEFASKKSAAGKELLRALYGLTEALAAPYDDREEGAAEPQSHDRWDSRWVNLFVDIDEEEFVCRFARQPDRKVTEYLLKKLEATPNFNKSRTVQLLAALFRLGHRDAPELLMDVLEKTNAKHIYYLDRTQLALLVRLPRAYADRLERVASGLAYEGIKGQFLEAVEWMRAKNEDEKDKETDHEKGAGWIAWIKSKMF